MRVSLDEIYAARERIAGWAIRTPLVCLNIDSADTQIYLKLENLQPVGSFKIRGAANRMLSAKSEEIRRGIWTASAGNMAQGAAWCARKFGVPCTVVAPDTAPLAKLSAIRKLGARIISVSMDAWISVLVNRTFDGMDGLFIHPFSDDHVMAGNGTIALEILEDLPDVAAIISPYGGGGLCCGIAMAIRALRPEVRMYAAEVDTAAPLTASWSAGKPVTVPFMPSFVDGIGAPRVFPEMFELASALLDGPMSLSVKVIADAVTLLAERNHVIAEGAGAASVAAALSGRAGSGKIACIVSGGCIDMEGFYEQYGTGAEPPAESAQIM